MFTTVFLFAFYSKNNIDVYEYPIYISNDKINIEDVLMIKVSSIFNDKDTYNVYIIKDLNNVIKQHVEIMKSMNLNNQVFNLVHWIKNVQKQGCYIFSILDKAYLN